MSRNKWERYPADEIARVIAALEETGNNRPLAAKALGMPLQRIHNIVNNIPELKLRFGKSIPKPLEVSPETGLERPEPIAPGVLAAREYGKVAESGNREAMADLNRRMGISDEDSAQLANLEEFSRVSLRDMIEFSQGDSFHFNKRLTLIGLKLLRKLEEVEEIDQIDDYLKIVDRLEKISAEKRKHSSDLNKIAMTRMQMERLAEGGKGKANKAEFRRKTKNVTPKKKEKHQPPVDI